MQASYRGHDWVAGKVFTQRISKGSPLPNVLHIYNAWPLTYTALGQNMCCNARISLTSCPHALPTPKCIEATLSLCTCASTQPLIHTSVSVKLHVTQRKRSHSKTLHAPKLMNVMDQLVDELDALDERVQQVDAPSNLPFTPPPISLSTRAQTQSIR